MKANFSKFLVLVVLAAVMLFTSACAPAVQPTDVLGNMSQIVTSKSNGNAEIMRSAHDLVMMTWKAGKEVYYVTLSGTTGKPMDYVVQCTTCKDWQTFKDFLTINGWKAIPAAEVPALITDAIMGAGATELVTAYMSLMPTIIVLPMAVYDPFAKEEL